MCLHVETSTITTTPTPRRPWRPKTIPAAAPHEIRGGTAADADQDEIFREIFLQKLPLTVRTALAIHKGKTLRDLAEMANNMVEVQGPQQNLQGQVHMLQQEDPK